jgi:hypothetical protein
MMYIDKILTRHSKNLNNVILSTPLNIIIILNPRYKMTRDPIRINWERLLERNSNKKIQPLFIPTMG